MKQLLKNWLFSSLALGFICICTPSQCTAQVNLIADGSFEDTLSGWNWNWMPINGQLKTWEWFYGVPSPSVKYIGFGVLMTTIAQNTFALIPNGVFSVIPRSGYNCLEMISHYERQPSNNFFWANFNMRCPIRTKLKQKLSAGKTYCGTFWVANQARVVYYNTNGMGMYFDNGRLDTVITQLGDTSMQFGKYGTAQIINYDVIHDSANYTKVQGSFIATGTEEYVTIGNCLTDSTVTKVINGPAALMCPECKFSEVVIDDASVIAIDIKNWLHDTFCAIGDSVWVGLSPLDFSDGKWYSSSMQYVTTGQGFWYTPSQAETKFIQSIEVCGALKYDTLSVYTYPLGTAQVSHEPNPLSIYAGATPGEYSVELPSWLTGGPLLVLDVTGKEIFSTTAQMHNIISLKGKAAGIYIVKVGNYSNRIFYQSF
jgi:hypothetical protein